jgi:hypothetical protein
LSLLMYDPSLQGTQGTILRLLDRWGRLPLSDVIRLLDPLQRPRFREELVKRMEGEGLITLETAGDEQVLQLTPRGRASLVEARPAVGPPRAEE